MGVAPWVPGSFIKNVEQFKFLLHRLQDLMHEFLAGLGEGWSFEVKFQIRLIQCKGELARPGRKKN